MPVKQKYKSRDYFCWYCHDIQQAQGIKEPSQKSLEEVCCRVIALATSFALLLFYHITAHNKYAGMHFFHHCFPQDVTKNVIILSYFSCFQQPRLYTLMQKPVLQSDPGLSLWSGSLPHAWSVLILLH